MRILYDNKNLVIRSYSGREHTIIDGQNLNNVFKISNVDSTSLLEGFTVRNGDATPNGTPSYPLNSGGGINLTGFTSYIKLKNLVVEHCNGANNGSGIYLRTPAKAVLENVIVQNNLNGGISISANGAHAILRDVLISDNANKPGIFIYDSGIEIYNSEISDNDFGGISYTGVGYIPNTFEDVLFLNNGSSISNGGAINLHIQGANTNITNCTFYNNGGSSDVRSDGGYFNDAFTGNNITIENSIFYESTPNSSRPAITATQNADPLAKDSIYISYCIFNEDTASSLTQNTDLVNFWSVNNLQENTDPLFVDAVNNNFDLLASSPAIDAGNPSVPLDEDGSVSDIGHNFIGADYIHSTPNINLGANVSYTWSTGETTAAIHPTPTQTTTYYVTATNGITTCEDSLTITVLPTSSLVIDSTVCDSMFFAGNTITTSGTYYDTIPNAVGCDSVVMLNLTIYNSIATSDSITACDSTNWNGTTYTTSGIYTQTLQTINGCDSVVTMDITINTSPVFTFPQDTLAACDVRY